MVARDFFVTLRDKFSFLILYLGRKSATELKQNSGKTLEMGTEIDSTDKSGTPKLAIFTIVDVMNFHNIIILVKSFISDFSSESFEKTRQFYKRINE